jgi:hypothetical protein
MTAYGHAQLQILQGLNDEALPAPQPPAGTIPWQNQGAEPKSSESRFFFAKRVVL